MNRGKRGTRMVKSCIGWLVVFSLLASAGLIIGTGFFRGDKTSNPPPAPVINGALTQYAPTDPEESATSLAQLISTMGPSQIGIPFDSVSPAVPATTAAVPPAGLIISLLQVGLDPTGWVDVPESSKAGVYDQAAPINATAGSSVVVGHINFPDGSWAPMSVLAILLAGAPIVVTDSSGSPQVFQVEKGQTLLKTALPPEIYSTEGERQLVLVTCGGPVITIDGAQVYSQNTVVWSKPAY